jgi:hypothetical protein
MRRLGARYVEELEAYLARRVEKASRTLVGDIARYHFMGTAEDAIRRLTVWIDYWGQAASRPAIRDVILEIQEGARGVVLKALLAQRPELMVLPEDMKRVHSAALLALIEGGLLQWRFAAESSTPFDREALGNAIGQAANAAARQISLPAEISVGMNA